MASRAELIKRATQLGEELGLDHAPTEGRSNAELTRLVAELEDRALERMIMAEEKPAPVVPQTDQQSVDPLAAQSPAVADLLRCDLAKSVARSGREVSRGGPPRFAYQVAAGKQITCRRGVLCRGQEVRPEWVGGVEAIEKLVEDGTVRRGPLARGHHPQS